MRRRSVVSVLLLATLGCAAELSPIAGSDGGTGDDGGARSDSDAAIDASGPSVDAGVSEDAFSFPANPDRDVELADSFEGEPGLRGRAACYDRRDNDATGVLDCDGDDCRALASCCLDRGDCCAPRSSTFPEALSFGCVDLAACFGEFFVQPFGSPSPFPVRAGLAAGGDTSFDSGVLVGEAIDLASERIVLDATFERTPCGDESVCVASFALGLTTQATLGDSEHVEPLVAMQVSAAREGVALLAAGREVARVPFSADARWSLAVRPDGRAELRRDGSVVASARIGPARARVVLYGHATNPSATADPGEPQVLLTSFGARVATCDMVRAWDEATEVVVFDGATPGTFELVTDVSVAQTPSARWLAFTDASSGRELLHVARDRSGFELDRNALPETHREAKHPTLAFDGANLFLLSERTEELSTSLSSLRFDEGLGVFVDDASLALDGLPRGLTETSLSFHRGHAVLTGRLVEGDLDVLMVFVRGPDTAGIWRPMGQLPLESARGGLAPDVVVHHDLYLLHYGWRRGAYGGLALAASDELVAWRAVDDDLLRATASQDLDRTSLDRQGAIASSALSDGSTLALYYVADDGVRRRLAVRTRLAPAGATFAGGTR